MKEPILVIMAGGMGSRYGGPKQIDPVGDNGEIIIDFSVFDAIEAGFKRIIFITKKELEADMREIIGDKVAKHAEVKFVIQDLSIIPEGYTVPDGRTKPWGTGHAILCCIDEIDAPFAVINADDYYGKSVYTSIHDYLCQDHPDNAFCMAGFILKNTLSENGGVTRGLCQVDDRGFLTDVVETKNIQPCQSGAQADGRPVDPNGYVSMNMWGLSPAFLCTLEELFKTFFQTDVPQNPLKAEYLLPILIGKLLQQKAVTVQVLPTQDKWFGVTYAADKAAVTESFEKLLSDGVYRADLYSDL